MTLRPPGRKSRSLLLGALMMSVALPAMAQEEGEPVMLGTIYITGIKRVQDALSFPGAVEQRDLMRACTAY